MEASDDTALARELARGSEHALAELFRRHRRPVYAQAFAETASRTDSEEVLQDSFLTLWQKRRRVRLVGNSLLPWLLVTAKNLARNRRRYQQRRVVQELTEHPAPGGSDPASVVARNELATVLADVLERLEPLDRQIVQLCLADGLSYREAAERLRSTHATVRNRLSRARGAVRAHLEAEGERGRFDD